MSRHQIRKTLISLCRYIADLCLCHCHMQKAGFLIKWFILSNYGTFMQKIQFSGITCLNLGLHYLSTTCTRIEKAPGGRAYEQAHMSISGPGSSVRNETTH